MKFAKNSLPESPLPAIYNLSKDGTSIDFQNQAKLESLLDSLEKNSNPKSILIGVTGGTASGKTSLCERIAAAFKGKIALLALDMFYKGLS